MKLIGIAETRSSNEKNTDRGEGKGFYYKGGIIITMVFILLAGLLIGVIVGRITKKG